MNNNKSPHHRKRQIESVTNTLKQIREATKTNLDDQHREDETSRETHESEPNQIDREETIEAGEINGTKEIQIQIEPTGTIPKRRLGRPRKTSI